MAIVAFGASGRCGFRRAAYGQDTVPPFIALFWIALVGAIIFWTKRLIRPRG